jgi:hypothetical protein
VIAGKTPTEVALPIAHNDPEGEWTLSITDTFTPETRQQLTIDVE